METTERVVNGLTILRVRGRLAASSEDTELETFKFVLKDLIARGCVEIAINLEGVKSVDAEGLGELVHAFTRVTRRGGRLGLIAPAERMKKLLSVTRLDSVLKLFASEQEAVDSRWGHQVLSG